MYKKRKLNDSVNKCTNPCPSKAIFKNKIKLDNSTNVSNGTINISSDNVTMKTQKQDKEQIQFKNTTPHLGVTAVIAVMEPATESQSSRAYKQPLRSRPSNKIRVLLDSGSDGDLYSLPKGKDKSFPYLTRQAPKSWCTSNGSFQTHVRGKFRLNFFEYSTTREYTIQPDIVEYD